LVSTIDDLHQFLQFDGTKDEIYRAIRGRNLLETKMQAIRNCEQQDLGVILAATLVPRVNINNIGNIIRFALENISVVRGVHFQPVSYFGRYPEHPTDADRLTLPELMRYLGACRASQYRCGVSSHIDETMPRDGTRRNIVA